MFEIFNLFMGNITEYIVLIHLPFIYYVILIDNKKTIFGGDY